jgi:hypothetical protein
MHTKLEIDVYSHWSDNPPVYRIYVDDEMLIERTFGWPSYQNYIREHLYCELATGVHTLRLENLDTNSRFELDHFTVDQNPVNKNLLKSNGVRTEWRFIVDKLLNTTQNNYALTIDLEKVSRPTPLAPPVERPKKVIQTKNYQTYIPLVQRVRQLNSKK